MVMPAKMLAAAQKWLAARRLTDAPSTVDKLELAVRGFGDWLGGNQPEITTFADVTRGHVLAWIQHITETPATSTGKPLGVNSRIQRISGLSQFFRDEIRRLPIDCLDRYPDGTARLRLPGRKTYKERTVPLREDAAALQTIIDLRKDASDRPFTDDRTGEAVRYLFMRHGKLMSGFYLFETSIDDACQGAGLTRPGGKKGGTGVRGTVSAHRFRHTVGTQLAERGAKLHTIMKVLGHSSVSMALVYAQISDQEVLRDYKTLLAPGAVIAGPAAMDIKSGVLADEAVDWLKSNFLKTELELGHCLRLPAEGPSECDLYLTCAKFVTTARC